MKRFSKVLVTQVALAMGLVIGMSQAAGAHPLKQDDPASVVTAFEKAVGSDVEAGLALLTADGVLKITPAPQGTTGLWTGTDELRKGLQYSKDHLVKRELVGTPQVDGNKVTDTVMVSNDAFVHLGIAPVQFSTEATVDNGKISSFSTTIAPSEIARVAAAAKAAQAPQADPAAIYTAFAKSVGTADIDGTLAMVTDDMVLQITPAPQGTTGLWTGKAEVRSGLEYARDHMVKHEFSAAPQVDGNKVTAQALLTNDFFLQIGVAPVQFTSVATIENGKIKTFTNTIMPSEQPRLGAAIKAFQAAHAAPQPAGMPTTGDPTNWLLAAIVAALGLVLSIAGISVRRAHTSAR